MSEKAREVGERMRSALLERGFAKVDEHMIQEVWRHDDGRQVVLTLIEAHFHDPVEAEVYDDSFKPTIETAYNSKGLVVLLDRGMQDAEATNEEGHVEEGSGAGGLDREADGAASEGSADGISGAGGARD